MLWLRTQPNYLMENKELNRPVEADSCLDS